VCRRDAPAQDSGGCERERPLCVLPDPLAARQATLSADFAQSPGREGSERRLTAVLAKSATAVALLLLLAPALALAASEPGTKNYETKVDAIRPPVEGLDVTTEGGDRYLVVKNGTGKLLTIPGYDGEAYLRFLPSGEVDVNENSPAKYLNEIRFGTAENVTIPKSALFGRKPDWQKVSGNGSYRWFDHRIHWMDKQPPAVVKDRSKRTKIFDWKVPARSGATVVTVAGTLSWIPTASSESGISGGAIAAIVAGVLVLLALAFLLVRRRSRPAGAPAPREKAGKEAW
jgi:hypothetical protein